MIVTIKYYDQNKKMMEKFFYKYSKALENDWYNYFYRAFIGSCVAIATKIFVNSILYLTEIRETDTVFTTYIAGYQINYAPIITILVAAFIINNIKKFTKITRFHGPADSILWCT